MKHARKVVVVFDDTAQCQRMEKELSLLGTSVQAITQGPSVFRTSFEHIETAVDVILLVSERAHLALVVANLRSILPYSGIIVMCQLGTEAQRTELLLAGADSLMPLESSATELAAYKHALRRRVDRFLSHTAETAVSVTEQHPSSFNADSPWLLQDKGWSMVSPSGTVIELTYGEKQLIELFSQSSDGRVSREDFIQIKSGGLQSKRAVDSLISRLKRKAAELRVDLPIRSVHGWGYSFAGRINREERNAEVLSAQEEQAQLRQQIEAAWQSQVGIEGRLSLQFQSRIQLKGAVQQGVEMQLYWDGTQRIRSVLLEQLDTPVAVALLERSIRMLCEDMREWQQVYRLSTPVQLSMPVNVLPTLQPILLKLLPLFAAEARNLELVLRATDLKIEKGWIALCEPLRILGVSLWLEHDVVVPSAQTFGLTMLEGLRFCYPDDDQVLSDQVQQTLLQACAVASEHGFKTIVGNVWNKARRDAAMRVGATYVQGEFLGSPMSRDGVLLGLASIESM
ncbi:MAG: hypothetical protein ACTJHW_00135 [Paenalcaligenes sp.]